MSNLNSECSQLSFGIHIVHIAQKMPKLRFSPMNFSRSTLVTLAPPMSKVGQVSKSLQVEKDPIYHLTPCLIDLNEK